MAAYTIVQFKRDRGQPLGVKTNEQHVARWEKRQGKIVDEDGSQATEDVVPQPAREGIFSTVDERRVDVNLISTNFTNDEGMDKLSLNIDLEGGLEGKGLVSRKTCVSAHLAPYIREWLKKERVANGYLPSSPLLPKRSLSSSSQRFKGACFSLCGSLERHTLVSPIPLGQPNLPTNSPYETSNT